MKKYVFESELTPEEIKLRLASTVRYAKGGWRSVSNTMFYEWIDDTHFMLIRTGTFFTSDEQLPFIGELCIEGSKTIISGCFRPDKAQIRAIRWIALTSFIIMLVFDHTTFWESLYIYLLWISMLCFFRWIIIPMLWRKANKDVIQYIQERLLK